MRASSKRIVIWTILSVVVVVGLLYAFGPVSIPVDLVRVTKSDLVVSIDDEGETRVRDVFVLSAPITGNARRILLEVGDSVTMNQTVITEIEPSDSQFLDPRSEAQARAAVKAAESNLVLAQAQIEQAQAEVNFAREELGRSRALIESNAISRRALDDSERIFRTRSAVLNTVRAALQVRTFELERARAALVGPTSDANSNLDCECIPVTAPVSGNVLRILHESAGIVTAGMPLAEIGDPNSIEVVVDLLSSDAVKVRPGQNVIIDEWGGDFDLHGVVRRVEPFAYTKVSSLGIEEQRVNVIIDFASGDELDPNLGHGYRVVARILMSHDREALTVPLTALFRDGDRWAVFAAVDGRAVLTHVLLGRRNTLDSVVTDGLSENAYVIAYPSDSIVDGVRIVERGS